MKRAFLFIALAACGDALAVASVSPTSIDARGGNLVTVQGTGFTDQTIVQFDGVAAASVVVVSASELHAKTPALFAGTSNVSITDPSTSFAFQKPLEILPLDLRYVQAPTYMLAPPAAPITSAVARDFDGDGDIDVVTCRAAELCRIALNDGTGSFTDPVIGDAGVGSRMPGEVLPTSAIAAADFDNDGDVDVFIGFASVALGAFEVNDGKAYFTQSPLMTKAAIDPVSAVAVGDLDGDGAIDLVLANTVADDVPLRVYFNHSSEGAIAFVDAPSTAVPSGNYAVTQVALGDIDGDGRLDIIMATPSAPDGRGLHAFLNQGGTFAATTIEAASANAPTALAVADLTGDGFVDIVAAGAGQDRIFVNDGTGHFFDATTELMPLDDSLATSVAIVDLDRDRHPDLLIGNSGAVTRMYINDGTGHFADESPRLSLDSEQVIELVPADVDGDGAPDVFVFGDDTIVRLFLSVEPIQ